MWLRSGKMMFWSNAVSGAGLNTCSGNACPSRSRERPPQPQCSPHTAPGSSSAKHSSKAAQQPLFPCSQAQGATAEAQLHWEPPLCSPPEPGTCLSTLNNCYSTGKTQPGENLCGFWKCSPKGSRENKQHRDTAALVTNVLVCTDFLLADSHWAYL